MTRYGYNCLRVDNASRDRLWQHCAKLPPGAMLFYNHQGELPYEFKRAFPSWIVVHRNWPDHQDFLNISPSDWYRQNVNRGRDGVIVHTQNETAFSDAFLDWSTELTKIARPDGTRFAHLNIATGNPNPAEWKKTSARRFLEENAKDGFRHFVCLHSYGASTLTSGIRGGNPAVINPAVWPQTLEDCLPAWHCGRNMFLFQACDEMGIPRPKVLLTEVGIAELGDVGTWQKALPKTAGFVNLDGWLANREVWRQWWGQTPGWTHEQAYAKQLLWALKTVWSQCDGVLVFSWGDSGGWSAFDVANAFTLHAEMEAGLRIAAPTPPPSTDIPFPDSSNIAWQSATIAPRFETANVRKQPKLASEIQFALQSSVRGIIAPSLAQIENGLKWYPIMVTVNALMRQGWVREDVMVYTVDSPPIPDDSLMVKLTKAERDALKAIAKKLP